MTTYGVTPQGYVRKPADAYRDQMDGLVRTEFGSGIIQTPQSPMGQFTGVASEMAAALDEQVHDDYQSYDPAQAEGVRLDQLGALRLMPRGERTDDEYRRAIIGGDADKPVICDLRDELRGIPGVTFAEVYENLSGGIDENGLLNGQVAVAVLGGDEVTIGSTIHPYIVPGIQLHGNHPVEIIDGLGYCRSLVFLRPIEIEVTLHLTVARTTRGLTNDEVAQIAMPSDATVATLVEELWAESRKNGLSPTPFRVRALIEGRLQSVEIVTVQGSRDGFDGQPNEAVPLGFSEIASVKVASVKFDA